MNAEFQCTRKRPKSLGPRRDCPCIQGTSEPVLSAGELRDAAGEMGSRHGGRRARRKHLWLGKAVSTPTDSGLCRQHFQNSEGRFRPIALCMPNNSTTHSLFTDHVIILKFPRGKTGAFTVKIPKGNQERHRVGLGTIH